MDPWTHILNCLNYDEAAAVPSGTPVTVTADQIKAAGKTWTGAANQFEPRLLCYQTSSSSRPAIFKSKGIYIFPIKNGTYILTKHNIYTPLTYDEQTTTLITRDQTSTILNIGGSETSLIDNLRYSGVFERPEILGEKITHGPLLNGRHRITLDMYLSSTDQQPIQVSGVQYETDSCFESANKILIIEGKSSAKPIDSFNIRQLYFPYREALRISEGKKEIICLFINELAGKIRIWKYTFKNKQRLDSITLTGYYIYTFSI